MTAIGINLNMDLSDKWALNKGFWVCVCYRMWVFWLKNELSIINDWETAEVKRKPLRFRMPFTFEQINRHVIFKVIWVIMCDFLGQINISMMHDFRLMIWVMSRRIGDLALSPSLCSSLTLNHLICPKIVLIYSKPTEKNAQRTIQLIAKCVDFSFNWTRLIQFKYRFLYFFILWRVFCMQIQWKSVKKAIKHTASSSSAAATT